jgi:UDP-4-amino-4,6-dideoxy-N-acetyl-beta-L-altrosamine transaminase
MTDPLIPYGRQWIDDADIDAVVAVLRSDWLTQGPRVPAFEKAVAERCQAGHGIAVNSGTSALHLACLALDVGPGDLVWTSPNTFVASANCARYCGAAVDFVDIDPLTWCMSVTALTAKLEAARHAGGPKPKVVIPVHFGGQPCAMAEIAELARTFRFRVIEDASHALGARDGDVSVGACEHSDITVLSFHPVKIITTGEGGMALTNDAALAARMGRLRTHGISRDPDDLSRGSDGPWYYEQIELGFNYRMTDIQAALGWSQLTRLDDFLARRAEIALRYDAAFADLPIRRQQAPAEVFSARHLYVIRVPAAVRSGMFRELRAAGIGVNVHYIPVHLQPYYRAQGFREGQFPEAEMYYREAISLPIFPALDTTAQDRVIDACKRSFLASDQEPASNPPIRLASNQGE